MATQRKPYKVKITYYLGILFLCGIALGPIATAYYLNSQQKYVVTSPIVIKDPFKEDGSTITLNEGDLVRITVALPSKIFIKPFGDENVHFLDKQVLAQLEKVQTPKDSKKVIGVFFKVVIGLVLGMLYLYILGFFIEVPWWSWGKEKGTQAYEIAGIQKDLSRLHGGKSTIDNAEKTYQGTDGKYYTIELSQNEKENLHRKYSAAINKTEQQLQQLLSSYDSETERQIVEKKITAYFYFTTLVLFP